MLIRKNPLVNIVAMLVFCMALINLSACANLLHKPAPEIVKSRTDIREYRYLTLENGLKVMLVSDPATDFSAASLDVYAGSGSDPAHRQGLAHFLEHMLFLGTEKYPEADGYMRFLKDNGCNHNAYTSIEHTNYFFDVKPEALDQALDRFAQFFIAPLLDEHYVEREKHAVHSEYRAGLKDESRRSLDVLREVLNDRHPLNNFSVGNLDTLSSAESPIKADLQDFYRHYYVAGNMAVAVLGREPLDVLQAMVEQRFAGIRAQKLASQTIREPLFEPGTLPRMLYVQPEKKLRELTLLFPLPDQQAYYRSKPLQVIGHVLGHEGQGSLLSYLKARNWVESLASSQALAYNGGSLFAIDIALTESGLQQQDAVIRAVFQAIARLQKEGVPRALVDEMALISQLEFDYGEKEKPLASVLRIANNLHYYAPAEVFSAERLLLEHDAGAVNAMLERLVIDNCLLVVVTDNFKPEARSRYYDVPYKLAGIDAGLRAELENIAPHPQIILPGRNPFLPDDLQLLPTPAAQSQPKLLVDKAGVQHWHQPVKSFLLPKATSYFSFRKPDLNASSRASVLLNIYVELLNDSFSEWVYPAQMAGLSLQIYTQARGVTLKIDGFSDKQDELLAQTLAHIDAAQFGEAQFQRIKATLQKNWKNEEQLPPYRKLMKEWGETLQKPAWSSRDRLAALQEVQLQDVQAYASTLWRDMQILGLTNGNISAPQSLHMSRLVEQFVEAPQAAVSDVAVVKLAPANVHVEVMSEHADNGYLLYWQADANDVDSQARYLLLAKALESAFFNELRTEQQLGYVVYSAYAPLVTVPGMIFVVQSPEAGVGDIHRAVMTFLANARGGLSDLSPDYLLQLQQALRQELLRQPLSLVEESDNYWFDLALGYPAMNRKQQLADAVAAVDIKAWQAFVNGLYSGSFSRMALFSTASGDVGGFGSAEDLGLEPGQWFYYR